MTVVLLSGGQDSATCLAWARRTLDEPVEALSINYGQRHSVELHMAAIIADRLGAHHTVLPLNTLVALGDASLTNPSIDHELHASAEGGNVYAAARGLPSSFIPGRNALLFAIAAAYGAPRGHTSIVTGVCEADDAGYPDCRSSFVHSMRAALSDAMDMPEFEIHAPLLHLDKARTFALAADLGILGLVLEHTNTCYNGDRSKRHAWGYGCDACPACHTRKHGFEQYRRMVAVS